MNRIYLDNGSAYIIERAQTEYSGAIAILQFIMYSTDSGVYDIPKDVIEYWYSIAIEKKIQQTQMYNFVLQKVCGCIPEHFTISPYYDYIEVNITPLNNNECNKRELRYNYIDDITGMYPERLHLPEDSEQAEMLVKEITFQVNDKCNLACTYCYQGHKGNNEMSKEIAFSSVDKILNGESGFDKYISPDKQVAIILSFIGGEPLLSTELISDTLDYFMYKSIILKHPWAVLHTATITTNGILYFTTEVQQLVQRYYWGLDVNVTVDGTKELHDKCRRFPDGRPTYDIAHAAAIDVLKRRNKAGTKITISPENVIYLSDCLKQMLYDGFEHINCNTVYEKGWQIEHATILYQQIKDFTDWFILHPEYSRCHISLLDRNIGKPVPEIDNRNWCGGNGNMLTISPSGDLAPCLRYLKSSLGETVPEVIIGSVDTGYTPTRETQECIRCLNKITRRSQSTDQCFYCAIAQGCAWCTAYNYQVNGTANSRVTYSCDMHKARTLGAVYFWNKRTLSEHTNDPKNLFIPAKWAIPIIGVDKYNELLDLCRKTGAYINDTDATMYKYKNDYDRTQYFEVKPEDLIIVKEN